MTISAASPLDTGNGTVVLDLPGDRVCEAQATFRATLEALAWPGTVRRLPVLAAAPLLNEGERWLATVLVMMLDHETTYAVTALPRAGELSRFVAQRTRAVETEPRRADVVVAGAEQVEPALLLTLRRGSLHYPDDSATVLLLVPSLDQASPTPTLILQGPGIDGERAVALAALSGSFWAARDEAIAQYPMGIDLLLVDDAGRLVGLPRTTRVTPPAEGAA